jgi:hypothetical protein
MLGSGKGVPPSPQVRGAEDADFNCHFVTVWQDIAVKLNGGEKGLFASIEEGRWSKGIPNVDHEAPHYQACSVHLAEGHQG